jgi:hypothetical protein
VRPTVVSAQGGAQVPHAELVVVPERSKRERASDARGSPSGRPDHGAGSAAGIGKFGSGAAAGSA